MREAEEFSGHEGLAYREVVLEIDELVGRSARVEVIGDGPGGRGVVLACRGEVAAVEMDAFGSSALVVQIGATQLLLSERSPWEVRKVAGGGLVLELAAGAEVEVEPIGP